MVRKEYFKQDPKVRENLEREIRILKLLRGYEYVVQILHVQVNQFSLSNSSCVWIIWYNLSMGNKRKSAGAGGVVVL